MNRRLRLPALRLRTRLWTLQSPSCPPARPPALPPLVSFSGFGFAPFSSGGVFAHQTPSVSGMLVLGMNLQPCCIRLKPFSLCFSALTMFVSCLHFPCYRRNGLDTSCFASTSSRLVGDVSFLDYSEPISKRPRCRRDFFLSALPTRGVLRVLAVLPRHVR